MHVCVCVHACVAVGVFFIECMGTNATKCMLQLQSEGSEGNLLRHRQDGHSGQVGDWIPSVPLAGWGVESQTTS